MRRYRNLYCPVGYAPDAGEPSPNVKWCYRIEPLACSAVANPVFPAMGSKILFETDYQGAGAAPLSFTRRYLNSVPMWSGFGQPGYWSHSFGVSLQVVEEPRGADIGTVLAFRAEGAIVRFTKKAGVWLPSTTVATHDGLIELRDTAGKLVGWQYRSAKDNSVEAYDSFGFLQSIRQRNGWTTTLTYSTSATPVASYLTGTSTAQPGQLISVRNHFGRELRFVYNSDGRMVQLVPPGAVKDGTLNTAQSPIRYGYDAQGNLTTVTWQDGTVKRYHYEDTRFPNHLTGITDEAGVRTNNYSYDDQGRATLSERGGERYLFSYGGTTGYSGSQTYITAPDGSTRTYTFEAAGGVIRPSTVTAPCPLCGSTAASTVWGDGTAATGGANARGQKFKEVAHDGTVTFYIYDTRGRETERATFPASFAGSTTRPALASASRVVSTQWHGTFNLPTRIAEPNKLTAYTYASNGNLTGQSVTTTTDATGAAKFSAARDMSQPIPSTGWSYNSQQLPVTIVERETPAGATVAGEKVRIVNQYSSNGDLIQRNATRAGSVGVVTSITYTVEGKTKTESRSGVASVFSYTPRGFLNSLVTRINNQIQQELTVIYSATGERASLSSSNPNDFPPSLASSNAQAKRLNLASPANLSSSNPPICPNPAECPNPPIDPPLPDGRDKNYDKWVEKCVDKRCESQEGSIGRWCCKKITTWACGRPGSNQPCCDCVEKACLIEADETNPLQINRCKAQLVLCLSGGPKK
ncbi:DUF6531 domain-containing protein [Piscinibacterium candidicorallinum]|uniref:DUF6531 domain-containing protein n=2 Tax=Piscinibacterium candidicorallinum TaxID=1793872 RepID=A0ABV7H189_9BURK